MRVALVADWLTTLGGAEQVLREFRALYPHSPLFTTVFARRKACALALPPLKTTPLQHGYRFLRRHQLLLPWMPSALECMDLRRYDLILSSSHAVGKGIVPPPHALHICYCHTPMRYAWEMEEEYLRDYAIPKRLRPRVRKILGKLRRWDLTTARRVDFFLANSTLTKERIARTYARESIVIHPPVADRFFQIPLQPTAPSTDSSTGSESGAEAPYSLQPHYYLAVGRLVPYKRFDFLIEMANSLHLPLTIIGEGQDKERLEKLAGPTVELWGYVPDDDLPKLYRGAKALLSPQLEDAGLTPLEAMACGTPVIAFRGGGALDTVLEDVTGVFFAKRHIEGFRAALRHFEEVRWDPVRIRAHVEKFSSEYFRARLKDAVDQAYEAFQRS